MERDMPQKMYAFLKTIAKTKPKEIIIIVTAIIIYKIVLL